MARSRISTALIVTLLLGVISEPAFAEKPKPDITFNLAGRTFTSKEKVRMYGDIDPATHAESVTLHVQRYDKKDDVWRNYDENVTKSDLDGSFSYRHARLPKGKYRARAEVQKTRDHRAGQNRWKQYSVRRRNF